MTRQTTRIINKTGLHARPASQFVQLAKQFESDVHIRNTDTGEQANAKSIVRLLTLLLSQGTGVEITAEGPDEEQAVQALVDLINSGFDDL